MSPVAFTTTYMVVGTIGLCGAPIIPLIIIFCGATIICHILQDEGKDTWLATAFCSITWESYTLAVCFSCGSIVLWLFLWYCTFCVFIPDISLSAVIWTMSPVAFTTTYMVVGTIGLCGAPIIPLIIIFCGATIICHILQDEGKDTWLATAFCITWESYTLAVCSSCGSIFLRLFLWYCTFCVFFLVWWTFVLAKNFIGKITSFLVQILVILIIRCRILSATIDAEPWHTGGGLWEEIVGVIILRVVLFELARHLIHGVLIAPAEPAAYVALDEVFLVPPAAVTIFWLKSPASLVDFALPLFLLTELLQLLKYMKAKSWSKVLFCYLARWTLLCQELIGSWWGRYTIFQNLHEEQDT